MDEGVSARQRRERETAESRRCEHCKQSPARASWYESQMPYLRGVLRHSKCGHIIAYDNNSGPPDGLLAPP